MDTDDSSLNKPSSSKVKKQVESGTDLTRNTSQDVNVFTQKALGLLVKATKAANSLPAAGDEHEYYSSFESFRHFRQTQSKKLLSRINTLLKQNGVKGKLDPSKGQDVEEMVDSIIEANDIMLERVGIQLDTATGVKNTEAVLPTTLNTPKVVISSWNRKTAGETKSKMFHLMQAKNIQRPQLSFKTKVNNTNTPFVPIIKEKPNALKPLVLPKDDVDISSVIADFIQQKRNQVESKERNSFCSHPYKYEIEHLEYMPEQLLKVEDPKVNPLEDTPLTLVYTQEALQELCEVLSLLSEFAVDLEAHTYRSFQGFACLIQISTGNHDYLVDALALRSDLHILNQSFTDPKIVKVFHGADMDVVWLQRDFGVYIVNLFDTGQASRVLSLARHSLAHLLKLYCDVDAAKEYQLADWRIRPIPEEMKKYAREDTHYLLYIYHTMKNLLLDRGNENKNLLMSTLDRSKEVCLKRYEKPMITEDAYLQVYRRSRKTLNKKQLFAFKLLYSWRDSIARSEDESIGYVLPNHMLFQIAENLPRESEGIVACCNPTPPLVRQYLAEVHALVVQARMNDKGSSESSEKADKTSAATFIPRKIEPLESLIYCPHDRTHHESHEHDSTDGKNAVIIADSSTLFGTNKPPVRMAAPIIAAFGSQPQSSISKQSEVMKKKLARILASLKSPFEMYLPSHRPEQISSSLLSSNKIDIPQTKPTKPTQVTTSHNQSPYVWRLKKPEEQPKVEESFEKKTVQQFVVKRERIKQHEEDEEEKNKEEEEEEVQPLRKKAKWKKKHQSGTSSNTSIKEENKDDVEKPQQFKAFDYSQSDYSTFSSDGFKHQKKGGKHFDPSREVHKFKGGKKSRTNPQSGKRSMSYKQGNPQNNRKKWPKR